MPRSNSKIVRPPPPEEEEEQDELDGWGVEPDEPEDGPGAPPAMPSRQDEPATPPSKGLVDLGPPPEDALGQASWARKVLMRQAYELMMSHVTDATRRKEVRTILRDAARHFTDAARYDYMQMAKRDREELERKKRGKAQGQMVERAPAGEGKLIPIRRDG